MKRRPPSPDLATGRMLSLEQAAEMCGLSPWTLRRWALRRRIDSVKLGGRRLIPERSLAEFIQRCYVKADAPHDLRSA